jgi:hypothetical protein
MRYIKITYLYFPGYLVIAGFRSLDIIPCRPGIPLFGFPVSEVAFNVRKVRIFLLSFQLTSRSSYIHAAVVLNVQICLMVLK